MIKSYVVLGIFLVIDFALMVTANVWAQEPIFPSSQGQPTPTPTPQPTADSIEAQIIGGQPADPGEYPWQVAIVWAAIADPFVGQICGGSLIDPE